MNQESLEQAIQRAGGPVPVLRNSPIRPHTFPVQAEFTNWRSEQRAWRDSCALLDQSHHMTDLYLKGLDAVRLLSDTGVNSFANFKRNKAKQFVAVNARGQFIGDCVLFCLDDDLFDLVTKLIRGPLPEVKFFNMHDFTIAGHPARGLRHGMAGQPGFELFGPWNEGEAIRDAILAAGDEFGLVQVGAKAYSTANLESGWIPSPTPAIFSGEDMKGYRQWLPAAEMGSLGGSLLSDDIEDYYLTPYDLGYGRIVSFDHDFIGREALEEISSHSPSTTVPGANSQGGRDHQHRPDWRRRT